jgi:hypothetical protein
MGSRLVEISIEFQYCLRDLIELPMYLERFSGEMPWAVQRKMVYVLEELPREPFLRGSVSSTTAKALLEARFIRQAFGETFVVSETGEEYYENHLKPKCGVLTGPGGALNETW